MDGGVEFQRLLQGQDIGKQRDLHHAGKAERLKGGAQLTRRDILGKLADKGRCNNGINRRVTIPHRAQHRHGVPADGEMAALTAFHTVRAAHAAVGIYRNVAVVIDLHGVKRAFGRAAGFIAGAVAVAGAPYRGIFLRMQQTGQRTAVEMQRFGADLLLRFPRQCGFGYLLVKFFKCGHERSPSCSRVFGFRVPKSGKSMRQKRRRCRRLFTPVFPALCAGAENRDSPAELW